MYVIVMSVLGTTAPNKAATGPLPKVARLLSARAPVAGVLLLSNIVVVFDAGADATKQ